MIGVDVARYGSDRSVVLVRQGDIVQDIQVYPRLDTMELVGRRDHDGARTYPRLW